jgi:nucleoside-diphosphate-sugar epimerase
MNSKTDGWVLVTGGTGFVGQALIKRLLGQGYKVRVATRSAQGPRQDEIRASAADPDRLQIFECDIAEHSSLAPAFEGVSLVFHSAALVNSADYYAVFERANVQATENICALSLAQGVKKAVFISTCDVFGISKTEEIITETMPFRRWNEPYADTKLTAAQLVKGYQAKGLVSTLIYPGWIYGPGDRAFLPSMAEQLKSGFMPIWEPAGFKLNIIYIEDLVDALMLCIDHPASDNDDFLIIDSDNRLPMADLYQRLASFLNIKFKTIRLPYWLIYGVGIVAQQAFRVGLTKRPELSTTTVKSFGFSLTFSNAKARNLLGWVPKTSFDVGIRNALAWYAEHFAAQA